MLHSIRLCVLIASALFAFDLHAQCDAIVPHGAPTHRAPVLQSVARGGGPLYLVPTVVRVHYGGALAPLSQQYIVALIDQCNADLRAMGPQFASIVPEFQSAIGDMGFELRLATRDEQGNCISGIRYHAYDPAIGSANYSAVTLNTRGYLNIHIGANQSFATLPGPVTNPYDITDVIMFGLGNATLDSHTLAHEVGHWAGLYHVWGISNTTGTCGDDFIADTPITAGSQLDCNLDQAECTDGVVENVQNFMDYSSCRMMFTQGQANQALSVLGDPGLVRNGLTTPANLLATGVTDPSSCAITAGIYSYPFINCDGTLLRFRALAEHALVDSVRWTFPGGSPSTSTDEHADVSYTNGGSYAAQLIVYGGGTSATVNTTVIVDVPNATANGLQPVSNFPFAEGFEGNFALPNSSMIAVQGSNPTWQLFTDAGFASARCLHVPAEPVNVADTNDIVIGNFDFSSLVQPSIRFKAASSMYTTSGWSKLQLRFRDLCSNIFIGNPWQSWELYEYGADHGTGFIPSNDGQWTTLQASFPAWTQAIAAELVLRLIRPAYPASFTPEAFYLDDLYIGELPLVTAVPSPSALNTFAVAPNPNTGHFTVSTHETAVITIHDARGQLVLQQGVRAGLTSIDAGLAPGFYLLRVDGAPHAMRMVVH